MAENHLERIGEAFGQLVTAVGNFTAAWYESIRAFAQFLTSLNVPEIVAYTEAEKEHSEWVHRAMYSKKKRIRKKYHGRIMRQYWRVDDGNEKPTA